MALWDGGLAGKSVGVWECGVEQDMPHKQVFGVCERFFERSWTRSIIPEISKMARSPSVSFILALRSDVRDMFRSGSCTAGQTWILQID